MSSTASQWMRVDFNIVCQWYHAVPSVGHRAASTLGYYPTQGFVRNALP
jgi:hypothetical protein